MPLSFLLYYILSLFHNLFIRSYIRTDLFYNFACTNYA